MGIAAGMVEAIGCSGIGDVDGGPAWVLATGFLAMVRSPHVD
jgi:hypothetical protein